MNYHFIIVVNIFYILCFFQCCNLVTASDKNHRLFHPTHTNKTTCVEKCTEDCLGIALCRNGKEIIVNCETQTGNSPYCDAEKFECVQTDEKCSPTSTCDTNLEGLYYPDLHNCQKYYLCNNGKGIPYKCPEGTRYNPRTTTCSSEVYCCYNFDLHHGLCRKNPNSLIAHPLYKSFYIFCDMQQGAQLNLCTGANFEFNQKSLKCEYVCQNVGRFKDEMDKECKRYYDCIEYGEVLIKQEESCPGEYIFVDENNDGTGKCMKPDEHHKC